MELYGHLLYIDITQICGIGCAFCMYADKHATGKHMVLSEQAKNNIRTLINDKSVKKISVSGEGEPLNNLSTFYEILALSSGGKSFEFITSGFFRHEKMELIYDHIESIVSKNGDTCNIRLSTDSHHIERVQWKAHGFSVKYFLTKRPSSLSFSFRSIDSERSFTREYLLNEVYELDLDCKIRPISLLEDILVIGDNNFTIDYKNLVNPSPETPEGFLNMYEYINAIEEKIGKPFTFGSLNKYPSQNGMDLTIKPNGDIFFYGIETECLGNINKENINWSALSKKISEDSLLYTLHTTPLTSIIEKINKTHNVDNLIKNVNNPYWLIKELSKKFSLLDEIKLHD